VSASATIRMERITRLLAELEYEVTRGIMAREIEPDIHLSKEFPCVGRGTGTAFLEVHVYPASPYTGRGSAQPRMPRLRLVEEDTKRPSPPAQRVYPVTQADLGVYFDGGDSD